MIETRRVIYIYTAMTVPGISREGPGQGIHAPLPTVRDKKHTRTHPGWVQGKQAKVQEHLYMETEAAFGGEEPGNTRRYARDSRGYTYKGKYNDPVRSHDPLRS